MTCNYTDENIHVDAVGIAFRATVEVSGSPYNISAATTKQLWFKKPDGTVLTKDADFVTDGSNGQIQYISTSGFLSIPGKWRMQGYVVIGANNLPTSIESFKVQGNLQ